LFVYSVIAGKRKREYESEREMISIIKRGKALSLGKKVI